MSFYRCLSKAAMVFRRALTSFFLLDLRFPGSGKLKLVTWNFNLLQAFYNWSSSSSLSIAAAAWSLGYYAKGYCCIWMLPIERGLCRGFLLSWMIEVGVFEWWSRRNTLKGSSAGFFAFWWGRGLLSLWSTFDKYLTRSYWSSSSWM